MFFWVKAIQPAYRAILAENRKGREHMGLKSKKQETLPNDAKPFATIPAFDNKHREPNSGVAIPTEEAVRELKAYMNINKQ